MAIHKLLDTVTINKSGDPFNGRKVIITDIVYAAGGMTNYYVDTLSKEGVLDIPYSWFQLR